MILDDLLFHIILNKNDDMEKSDKDKDNNNDTDISYNCCISLFIYKGKESEFKVYAYSLLEKMIPHIEPKI